jgi:hypothetical protein
MERNRSKKAKVRKPRQNSKIMDGTVTVLRPCPKLPEAMNLVHKQRTWRRFQQFAAVSNQGFSLADGHSQFLVVTNVLGNAVPFVDCWRIRRIRVWLISEGNLETNCVITPVGADNSSNNFNDPEQVFQCTSRSQAEPASMEIVAAKDKPLGSWHFTSNVNPTGVLFQLNITTPSSTSFRRTTMDIEFETVKNLVGLPLGYGVVTATTTLGTMGGRNILTGMGLTGINNLG